MTIDDYKRNLRGVNDGTDFSSEFLVRTSCQCCRLFAYGHLQQNIYDSIRKREIVMPEEHTGQLGFEYAWKELLARSRQTGRFVLLISLRNNPEKDTKEST
jgi:brefeldin A-resistance guanine nucleotide exchange factor 1